LEIYEQIDETRAKSGAANFENVNSGCGSAKSPVVADAACDRRKQAPS
jgi:hypothetical protein